MVQKYKKGDKMKTKEIKINTGKKEIKPNLPSQTDIFKMRQSKTISDPQTVINRELDNSEDDSLSLKQIIKKKLAKKPSLKAVIVISDNTRPVPYTGDNGILWPIIKRLLINGVKKENILILVATGTHRALSEKELKEMLDDRVFKNDITIKNHDCQDEKLCYLGTTERNDQIYLNRDYMNADLKILTGLVESHFMAGASGGRKSICPGLIGEESTYLFHGPHILDSPNCRDLVLEGNPCHEEALQIAKLAGVDYIVNVTLDHNYNLTGVFAGDLEIAHKRAVEKLKEYVVIPFEQKYDIVITHGGFVGLNHYQVAKAAVVTIPILKKNSKLIIVADTYDQDPLGSQNYKTVLHLLKLMGHQKFNRLLKSSDWQFIPDQWQVQMWSKLFKIIKQRNLIFYSPQLKENDYQIIPGLNGSNLLGSMDNEKNNSAKMGLFIEKAVNKSIQEIKKRGEENIKIACLSSGPYGILKDN